MEKWLSTTIILMEQKKYQNIIKTSKYHNLIQKLHHIGLDFILKAIFQKILQKIIKTTSNNTKQQRTNQYYRSVNSTYTFILISTSILIITFARVLSSTNSIPRNNPNHQHKRRASNNQTPKPIFHIFAIILQNQNNRPNNHKYKVNNAAKQ